MSSHTHSPSRYTVIAHADCLGNLIAPDNYLLDDSYGIVSLIRNINKLGSPFVLLLDKKTHDFLSLGRRLPESVSVVIQEPFDDLFESLRKVPHKNVFAIGTPNFLRHLLDSTFYLCDAIILEELDFCHPGAGNSEGQVFSISDAKNLWHVHKSAQLQTTRYSIVDPVVSSNFRRFPNTERTSLSKTEDDPETSLFARYALYNNESSQRALTGLQSDTRGWLQDVSLRNRSVRTKYISRSHEAGESRDRSYDRYYLDTSVFAHSHDEYGYLELLEKIIQSGEIKPDRTGVGTFSIFGPQLSFDLRTGFPLLTTKYVSITHILEELLFFIHGETDTTLLEAKKVNIWKGNTRRAFLDNLGLNYDEGMMGPMYGYQWRHWNAPYVGSRKGKISDQLERADKGIDQLESVIESIKTNPHSRRHIISSWNVSQLKEMVLPPCHVLAQFNVSGDGKYLDCQLYQRSADVFLGVPYNIASYAALTYMIASIVGLKPRRFVHAMGDAHLYKTHLEAAQKQLERTPMPFPKLEIDATVVGIGDFNMESFRLVNYHPAGRISAKMAI